MMITITAMMMNGTGLLLLKNMGLLLHGVARRAAWLLTPMIGVGGGNSLVGCTFYNPKASGTSGD